MNRMIVRRTLIKILRIRKVMKRIRLSVCMKKGRQLLNCDMSCFPVCLWPTSYW